MPLSCAKLPEPGSASTLMVQELPSLNEVPVGWGALVSTSPMPNANASALWFQDDSGTVRMVAVDHELSKLWPQALVIRRR
jgi:hypothetical protein